jgi:hypothetical protein
VTTNLRTLAKLEHVVTAQSTTHPDGFAYVIPATINIDGLSRTPVKHGLLSALRRKFAELLHVGYVTQWETSSIGYYSLGALSRGYAVTETILFYSWFTIVDFGHVWMLIKGYINQLYV